MESHFSVYEGCSLHSTGIEYNKSICAVFEHLGIKLDRIKNWNCCGASKKISHKSLLSLSLPVRNLAEAEKEGKNELIVPCASCYNRLKYSLHIINENENTKKRINDILKYEFKKSVKIFHPLEVLSKKEFLSLIIQKAVKLLKGIKVIPYYGCLITRPATIMSSDDVENPKNMDRILSGIGMEVIDSPYKTECCGASMTLIKKDVVMSLCNRILRDAKEREADVIAVACPLCHGNLDLRQSEIEKYEKTEYKIPILYFTELIGLAFNLPHSDLGIDRHFVNAKQLLDKTI